MQNTYSKIRLLYMITDLKEKGDIVNAIKLQKIFVKSISDDRKAGGYDVNIKLDRKSKKAITTAINALKA